MFLAAAEVRNFDQAAATEYGELERSVGIECKSFDRFIAAHALALEYVLVTNNEKNFTDVPGLKVENWTV